MTCKHPGCREPEDYHLHRPSSECEGCLAPHDHHAFEPSEDPKDIIIRTLTAEVEHLANALEICGKNMGGAWTPGTREQVAGARALLVRLEARP